MYKLIFEICEDENYNYEKVEITSATVEEGLDKLYEEVWSAWHMGCSVKTNFSDLNNPEIIIEDCDSIAETHITIEEL